MNPLASAQRPAQGAPRATAIRWVQALAFVAIWIGLGLSLKLDANSYLLLGVPLTAAFQLGIRRRPLRELWVRDGAALRITTRFLLLALAMVLTPITALLASAQLRNGPAVAWSGAAILGAFAAAYALCQFSRSTTRQLLLCLATVGAFGALAFVGAAIGQSAVSKHPLHPSLRQFFHWLLLYFPVVFVIEEVSFRGLLDAHVQPDRGRFQFASALFVSAMWGLWHWPAVPHGAAPVWQALLSLVIFHSLLGVPLSYFWRKSGNLAVPGFTHAFIDAVRNALLN